MSLIVRYVNFSSNDVTVEESFLGFLNVKGLFDITYNELKSLGLDIDNMRGEGMPMDQTWEENIMEFKRDFWT